MAGVTAFIPDVSEAFQELVVADRSGNVWGGFTGGRTLRKYVKKQATGTYKARSAPLSPNRSSGIPIFSSSVSWKSDSFVESG